MSERQGIEIDYCPSCRGVWLDRGELDKIIERSNGSQQTSYDKPTGHQSLPASDDTIHRHTTRHYDSNSHHKKKRRESFLGDLFDF